MGRISTSRNATGSASELIQSRSGERHRDSAGIIGGSVAAGVFLVALVAVLLAYRRLRRSRSPRTTPASESSPIRLRRFTYRELRGATGRFSEANKLGQGGFGCVYKGTLRSGQQIAVKKLESASLQGEREFMNELSIVGGIPPSSGGSHIVGLIGFCADSKRKMLVYEFMANRSLQEALFDEKRRVLLAWEQRVRIVVDVAQALAFIHGKCEPPIVHGDVKPSNVLLDAGFSAKLADFGLARVKSEQAPVNDSEVQRDLAEQERRIARDRERRRRRKSLQPPEDHHVIQVSESEAAQASAPEEQQAAGRRSGDEKSPPFPDPEGGEKIPALADLEKGKSSPGANDREKTRNEASDLEESYVKSEEEKKLVTSATSGDEQLTDGSGGGGGGGGKNSPVLSSPASNKRHHRVNPGAAAGAGDDDDEWSKMSQSANGTEAETWSKMSPSEVDCRSEISLDSSNMFMGGNHRLGKGGDGGGGGMSFLSKKAWSRKKGGASSSSPLGGGGGSGGKDWWWKQEEHRIKDYIVDWVSCESRRGRPRTRGSSGGEGKRKKKARSGSLEWWAECDDGDEAELARRIKSEQKRKRRLQKEQEKLAMSVTRENSREWWRDQGPSHLPPAEEFSGELKYKQGLKLKRSMSEESFTFCHSGDISGNLSNPSNNNNNNNNNNNPNPGGGNPSLGNSMELLPGLSVSSPNGGRRRVRTRSREWWSGEMQRGREWWSGELSGRKMMSSIANANSRLFESWSRDSLSGELNQQRSKNHHQQQLQHQRHRSRSRSRDWWSGDLVSRATTVSSTPSMRGTVCYVAPEYGGGGGALTEKADVYSFGVLVLVVVSGRRPLQVVASPVSEFERANLISWARHAAQAGRGLDLVDASLTGAFDKEQAGLFISVALLCLQRLPSLRPSMSEVVKILTGEAELPALPFEFSPSPQAFKSRRKGDQQQQQQQVAVEMPLLGITAA